MSYEPLHHKYRPQTFAHLVGQEAIATTLTNAIQQQRIAPAYLFTGPRGTGKTSSARIFAKSLNCLFRDVPTESPCGKCEVCTSIAKGSALDVIEIDAASNTGVDNIREIIERAQFAPVQCRYKVYIIDEVHMLSTAAFNALLKTLEEPPDRVVFVLATTDPQRVLPTIISRCQRFDFRRIPLEEMVAHLRHIAHEEKINITKEAITLIGQVAQGGLRDAESLLDQLSLISGEVTVEKVWDLVGAVPERDLMEILQAISGDNPTAVLDIARRLMDRGREPLIVLQNLASFYRDLLIAKSAPNRPELAAVTEPTWQALCDFSSLGISQILAGQKLLKDSEFQLKNTTQPRLWLEVTLLSLLPSAIGSQPTFSASPVPVIPQRMNPVSLPTKPDVVKPESTPVNPSAKVENTVSETEFVNHVSQENHAGIESNQAISQPVEISVSEVDLEQLWRQVLEHLQNPSKSLFRDHGCLLELNDRQVKVGIRNDALLRIAQPKIGDIETVFHQVFNLKVKVILQVNSTNQTQNEGKKPGRNPTNKIEFNQPVNNNFAPKYEPNHTTISPASTFVEKSTKVEIDSPKTNPSGEELKQLKATTPTNADEVEKLREENTKEIPLNDAESEILQRATQRLIEMFKGEIIELAELKEEVKLTDKILGKTEWQPLQIKLEFDDNFELEEDDDTDF